jgi:hypothetical protein
MATIVALCPYCRRGGVRAPERSIGSLTTCTKCSRQFTIVPKEQAEDLTPGPVSEPKPVVVAPVAAEPSPVPIAATPNQPVSERDPAFTLCLIAFTCFGLGVVATQFPFGRWIGLGLCGLGLLLGLGCLLAEGRVRKFGAAAAGLNLIAVLLLAIVPDWLGFTPQLDDSDGLLKGSHSISLNTNDIQTAGRIDAGKAVYANDDVRIGVRTAVQPLELVGPNGAMRTTRERVLKVQIAIANAGVQRRIPLLGWAAGNPGESVQLTDPAGTPLKVKALDAGWKPAGFEKSEGIFPGKSAEVVLLFEPPASSKTKRIDYLNLELPGSGVGLIDPIRFTLPGPF